MSSDRSDPMIGTRIRAYHLTRLIGRGAMGMVYAAEHDDSGLKVAVKFLTGDYAMKKEFIARFMHEAEACRTMQHENLIRVFEAGVHEDVYFMVMEFVDGIDLAYFLETQERVKESQALPWLKQTVQALAYAHAQGIIHRDLKPENIMLTREGVVKLADLGLSKRLDADENLSMTLSGTVIGTPYYISPEQTKNAKRVDARTDIYSLGATFYHLLTGRPPFAGHSAAEVMAKHMNEPLTPPQRVNPAISDHMGDLLCKMMEKEPDKRFAGMPEVLDAIERIARGEAPISKTVRLRREAIPALAPPSPSGSRRRNFKARFAAGGLVALAVVLAIGGIWFFRGTERETSVRAPAGAEERAAPPPREIASAAQTTPASSPPSPSVDGASDKDRDGEEEVLRVERSAASAPSRARAAFRLVDALGFLLVAMGVIVARHHGLRSSCFRAAAVWAALGLAMAGTAPFAAWLAGILAASAEETARLAFLLISAPAMVLAWVATHPFDAREKERWTAAVGRFLAVIPGAALGAAFAFWAFALMGFLSAAELGVADSWVGSRVISSFPALQKAVDSQSKRKQ